VTRSERLTRVWTAIALQAPGKDVTVADVCRAMVAELDVDGAGLTMTAGTDAREILHATDEVAAAVEALQVTTGEGPCVDALAVDGPVLAADLHHGEYHARWPAFTPAAVLWGARAVFALPLHLGAIRLGALDLYRRRPGSLTAAELADALIYADTAGLLLLDGAGSPGGRPGEPDRPPADLGAADAVVHQATGMLIVQLGVDARTALLRLRAHAFAQGRPLSEVARDVVERRLRLEHDAPRPGHPTTDPD
jgi:hypothetical protein